jgi:hypothetical protein
MNEQKAYAVVVAARVARDAIEQCSSPEWWAAHKAYQEAYSVFQKAYPAKKPAHRVHADPCINTHEILQSLWK